MTRMWRRNNGELIVGRFERNVSTRSFLRQICRNTDRQIVERLENVPTIYNVRC